MKRLATTFVFTAEFGARLRQVRRAAGLSLRELAHVMGRKPGYHVWLGRLEVGRMRYPSLALVADYLRACRRSFADIVPLLNEYTAKRPVRETREMETVLAGLAQASPRDLTHLLRYDRRVTAARRVSALRKLAPGTRAQAITRQARVALEQRALAWAIESEVNRLSRRPTTMVRTLALDYGRMVWKALRQTERREGKGEGKGVGEGKESKGTEKGRGQKAGVRKRRGRPRKTRAQRLAEAEARARALGPGILGAKDFRQLRKMVVALYELAYPPWSQAGPGPR